MTATSATTCDCPARVLDDALTGTGCEVCGGVIPPLTAMDRRLLASERSRALQARSPKRADLRVVDGERTTYRARVMRAKPTVFVDWQTGIGCDADGTPVKVPRRAPMGRLLDALPDNTERVYLTGPRPYGTAAGGWSKFSAWAMGELGDGWEPGRHYLDDPTSPVLHYAAGRRRVEVHRGAIWGVGDKVAPHELAAALRAVGAAMVARFGEGCSMMTTPATWGREAWLRTVPRGGWAVLPADQQAVIRSTSGQGRIEVCTAPELDTIDALFELDMRHAYAACCNELGAGPMTHDDRAPASTYERGRYRVRFTVPAGWSHVGLFPVMQDRPRVGWWWPAEPGWSGECWVDGSELHVATAAGWSVEVLERLVMQEQRARPLDKWAAILCDIAADFEGAGDVAARAIVRSVIVKTIGAFVGRPRSVTVIGPVAPAGTPFFETGVGELVRWTESESPRWSELSHPEWAAAIWGRCRARLLSSPGGAGVLSVERSQVIAFRTDAVYLTTSPGWPDDGRRPGQFSVKWSAGSVKAPHTTRDLYRLRGIGAE